jgi:hypothetical protein
MEELFGRNSWNKLKENAELKDWKVESKRLLRAIATASHATVMIADPGWKQDLDLVLSHGQKTIASADTATTLFACLAATLARTVFHQLGHMPNRRGALHAVPLTPRNWTLTGFRSVQYVQSPDQIAALDRMKANLQNVQSTPQGTV